MDNLKITMLSGCMKQKTGNVTKKIIFIKQYPEDVVN